MATASATESSPVARVWKRLTDPAPDIQDPSDRRTARLLSTLLASVIPLALVSVALQMVERRQFDRLHAALLLAIAALICTYLLSRTEHFRVAAGITALIPTAGGLAVVAADSADPGWFAFMALSPALGTLLLPLKRASVLGALNLLAVALAVVIVSDLDTSTAVVALMFNAIATVILLTATRHRDQLEQVRRAELVSRQRLNESILESSFGGIAVHHQGAIEQANEVFGAMFGLRPDGVRGTDLRGLFDDASQEMLAEIISSSTGRPVELVAVRGDGSTFNVEVLAPPIVEGRDEVDALAVQDITERKEASDALIRAQRMESVGRLAAGLAHDTNNQLAVIMGNAEILMSERAESGLSTDRARIIRDAADQITTLARRMMLAGRGRASEPVVIDLGAFVDDLRPMWERVLGPRIDLLVVQDAGLGHVYVDRSSLEQVFLNLVLNARDAMRGAGEIRIEMSGLSIGDRSSHDDRDALPADRYQQVTVCDTGEGISVEHLDQVFQPFFTTKDDDGGTGLGLYTSREVIRDAGGALTVQSDSSGTCFRLLLPEVDPVETAAAAPDEAASDGDGGQLIVVVDDNDLVRAAVVESLQAEGHRVVDVASAEEALGQIRAMGGELDAVLTDLTMPGMGGGELVDVIEQNWPHVRCVVMSGYQESSDSREVAVALYKPFNFDELKQALSGN